MVLSTSSTASCFLQQTKANEVVTGSLDLGTSDLSCRFLHRTQTRVIFEDDIGSSMTAVTVDATFSMGGPEVLRYAYDQYGGIVFALCSRTLPKHLAEETTQDVFLKAWRHRHRFDSQRGTLVAWLIGITKNSIIDHLRAEQRHRSRQSDLHQLEQSPSHAVVDVSEVDHLASKLLIAEAMRNLNDMVRTVVYAAFIEDLTHPEVARKTGLPLGTVKSHIRRGLAEMKQYLEVNDG